MQDIEKNMDDLFRKAVGKYQLKSGESNWNKILPQLSSNPVIPPAPEKKNNTKKYFMLLLLLMFLLTSGLFTKYMMNKNAITASNKSLKNKINNADKEKINLDKKANTVYKKQSKEQQSVFKNDELMSQYHQQNDNSLFIKKSEFNDATIAVTDEIKNTQPKVVPLLIEGDVNKKSPALINQYNSAETVQNKSVIEEKVSAKDSMNKVAIKLNPVQRQHGIYFGTAIGVSFNSVKYQGFRKPGFDIGLIAGYQISNKASVETGLFFGKKNYFTDGKYFSMDKVGSSMPPEMKILSLKGSSTLFQIPLKFKYNILEKKKTIVSSSAGISSYLLTNEKNNYLTSMNGTRENIISSYENSSRYFAAALDFSITYEHKFSNNKNIRIDPYVQIPLKGIGMGTLPVMSAGLHLGFTVFPKQ
jgi:hypothetical protein